MLDDGKSIAMLMLLISLIWLVVTALVVTTCQVAARADGRATRPMSQPDRAVT